MSWLKSAIHWLLHPRAHSADIRSSEELAKELPPIKFVRLVVLDKAPKNSDVASGIVYCVAKQHLSKWALFSCPCGCGDVITLSLQSIHRPHWRLSESKIGYPYPTLQPSVWRDTGCFSHFWLKEGRVFWCSDTGTKPRVNTKTQW